MAAALRSTYIYIYIMGYRAVHDALHRSTNMHAVPSVDDEPVPRRGRIMFHVCERFT